MKKAEYYINIKLGEGVTEYPKVSGWIEEVEDSKGNKLTIGYDKRDATNWIATELNTGLGCTTLYCKTKAECVENVHNNIDRIVEAYDKNLKTDWGKKFVQPFRDFVEAQE